jgi:hypothetical protein
MAILHDLVPDHGFQGGYQTVRSTGGRQKQQEYAMRKGTTEEVEDRTRAW